MTKNPRSSPLRGKSIINFEEAKKEKPAFALQTTVTGDPAIASGDGRGRCRDDWISIELFGGGFEEVGKVFWAN